MGCAADGVGLRTSVCVAFHHSQVLFDWVVPPCAHGVHVRRAVAGERPDAENDFGVYPEEVAANPEVLAILKAARWVAVPCRH